MLTMGKRALVIDMHVVGMLGLMLHTVVAVPPNV